VVNTIHDLRSTLNSTILAWEKFRGRQSHWFEASESGKLKDAFRISQDEIEKHVAELISNKELLDDRFTQFEGMLQRVSFPRQFIVLGILRNAVYYCVFRPL
jgi:hypothetical protein